MNGWGPSAYRKTHDGCELSTGLSDTGCHGYDLNGIAELLPNRHCESRLILLQRHVRSQTEASIDRHSSRRISSLTLTKSNRE